MEEKISENRKAYLEKIKLYMDFGYDIEKERRFILEKSYPLYGEILEVGTGKGHFTLELAKEGNNFISLDVSKQEQDFARQNVESFGLEKFVDFRIEDAEHLSFDDNSFDIIFSINAVHHFINPLKILDELIRIISFEGKIILSDFSKEGLELISKIHAGQGREHKAGGMNLLAMGNYLKDKGFRIERHSSRFQDLLIAYHQII
ncbi:MAG: class I SAM-dependent methyltransferase [Candidatus Omnitrophica bacterium]|nr:class I SAM-dependent methyltransferase [Candidatus Omnitrophota bacterium]